MDPDDLGATLAALRARHAAGEDVHHAAVALAAEVGALVGEEPGGAPDDHSAARAAALRQVLRVGPLPPVTQPVLVELAAAASGALLLPSRRKPIIDAIDACVAEAETAARDLASLQSEKTSCEARVRTLTQFASLLDALSVIQR